MIKRVIKLLLDSGAYSAFRQGVSLNLSDYIAFIKRNEQYFDRYISFDTIPGTGGRRTLDSAQVERAAQQTYRDHQRMKDAGLTPIPVFHQDDDFKWLARYLSDREPYIALAAHGGHAHNDIPWFDDCFALIERPRVKIHCLGNTKSAVLRRFPFTSTDSSSWLQQAKVGRILVPLYVDGRPDYSHPPMPVVVTKRSNLEPNYIDRLSSFKRQQAERYLDEEIGVELAEVSNRAEARWRTNAAYFKGLAAANNTTLFFVTSKQRSMRQALLQSQATAHLLSYFDLRHRRSDTVIKDYVEGATIELKELG
ncbi:MAG: hypothetical protein WAK55_22885 [Xanthobacteraceae bacterium]